MANGLNVRDFFKQYREVRYANEGSIRLGEIEHNAYLNRLTLEVTHYDAYRSISYKTNPENTHWGYLTAFKGTAVVQNQPVKFVKQRVYEHINQGMWNFHQSSELMELLSSFTVRAASGVVNELLDQGGPFPGFEKVLDLVETIEDAETPFLKHVVNMAVADPEGIPSLTEGYTAYPIASPFPDVWKFKGDIPCSFLFRLESWFLVNPLVYIVNSPTDTTDETDGEDEYPQPEQGDGDGDSQEFPDSSPADPNSDPRDGGAKPEPELDPTVGYTWTARVTGTLLGGDAQPGPLVVDVTFTSLGSGFPFTAEAAQSTIIVFQGESWAAGFVVKDRFGQVMGTFSQNVGVRRGPLTINARVVL